MYFPTRTFVLAAFIVTTSARVSGSGKTTRYWDCCKSSCSWNGKATLRGGASSVQACDINDKPLADFNAVSGCNGGTAYQCSHESPWAISDDLAYGYAAVNIGGGNEASWCCACYELTFTSGPVSGKKMIVQATNTGGDLGENHFDITMPGGGVGIFNGCTAEWGAPASGWGAQYGGISSRSACDSFPAALKEGCYWRFDWFKGADNPTVDFKQVSCPAALTKKTGCVRADDAAEVPAESPKPSVVKPTSTAVAAAPVTTSTRAVSSPHSTAEPIAEGPKSSSVAVIVAPISTPSPSSAAIIPVYTSAFEEYTPTSTIVSPISSTAAVVPALPIKDEDEYGYCEL